MKNNEPRFSMTFHKILINGLIWVCAAMLVIFGIINISHCWEDHVEPFAMVVIGQCILFVAAILLIKARFDLAAMKLIGPKVILIAGLAAAAVFLFDLTVIRPDYGSVVEDSFLFPLLPACWGITVYRYYMMFRDQLKG